MGFKQKLSEKNLILHFWILSSDKLAMRAVSPVGNEQYPLIEFKIKQVVIWKNWTHLQGRVLGIIFVCILLLKHHNLLNYLIRVAFWVLLHAIHVRLKTDKVIRKRFWQTFKTKISFNETCKRTTIFIHDDMYNLRATCPWKSRVTNKTLQIFAKALSRLRVCYFSR